METFFKELEHYNEEHPLEITDMLNSLDKIIEHDARTLGEQQMQIIVLKWAIEHREQMSAPLRDTLVACMEQELARMKAERPKAVPVTTLLEQEKAVTEPKPPLEVTEEHREQGATDMERAYPDRRP